MLFNIFCMAMKNKVIILKIRIEIKLFEVSDCITIKKRALKEVNLLVFLFDCLRSFLNARGSLKSKLFLKLTCTASASTLIASVRPKIPSFVRIKDMFLFLIVNIFGIAPRTHNDNAIYSHKIQPPIKNIFWNIANCHLIHLA